MNKLYIRCLRKSDIQEVIILLESYHNEMGFSSKFDVDTIIHKLYTWYNNPFFKFYVAEENYIVGICGIMFVPTLTNNNVSDAIEFIWHSNVNLSKFKRAKIMIEMLKTMETATILFGAKTLHISLSSDEKYKSLTKYVKTCGYSFKEQHFIKEV